MKTRQNSGLAKLLGYGISAAGLAGMTGSGCPSNSTPPAPENNPPSVSLKLEGKKINPTTHPSYDLFFDIGEMERESLKTAELSVKDEDGPYALAGTVFPTGENFGASIRGENSSQTIDWYLDLTASETATLGSQTIAEGAFDDGFVNYTTGPELGIGVTIPVIPCSPISVGVYTSLNDIPPEARRTTIGIGAEIVPKPCPIACHENADCGEDSIVGDTYCVGNDVYQDLQTWSCNNAGTPESYCESITSPNFVESCDGGVCLEGICEAVTCFTDEDCDDGNSNTQDTCHEAGTPDSYCENKPKPGPGPGPGPTPPPCTYTIGDGICDMHCDEPYDSPDCVPAVRAYFVDSTGTRFPNDIITENPARLEVRVPTGLEPFLKSGSPYMVRSEENGEGDCNDINSYTGLTRTSAGVYHSAFDFIVGEGCDRHEAIAGVVGLELNDSSFTTNNIYGSALVHYDLTPVSP
jgi:hypothetical protein